MNYDELGLFYKEIRRLAMEGVNVCHSIQYPRLGVPTPTETEMIETCFYKIDNLVGNLEMGLPLVTVMS